MRIFILNSKELPDPDPALSVQEVQKLLADFAPDVANAAVTETKRGEDVVIEFTRRVGTKGAAHDKRRRG